MKCQLRNSGRQKHMKKQTKKDLEQKKNIQRVKKKTKTYGVDIRQTLPIIYLME